MRGLKIMLFVQILALALLSFAMGYAAHRDGPWSLSVLGDGFLLAVMGAVIVVTVWMLLADARAEGREAVALAGQAIGPAEANAVSEVPRPKGGQT